MQHLVKDQVLRAPKKSLEDEGGGVRHVESTQLHHDVAVSWQRWRKKLAESWSLGVGP